MKWARTSILAVLFLILFFLPVRVYAQGGEKPSPNQLVNQQISGLGLDDIKQYWDDVTAKYGGYLPESQKGSLTEFIKGEKHFNLKEWGQGLAAFLFHEFLANGKLLGTLILLTIFSMVLQSIQSAFEHTSVSKVAYSVIYMVLIILALNSFHVAIDFAESAIDLMLNFMIALLPLLLALMAAAGGVTSVAFFHPVIIFLVNTSGLLIKTVTLPLLFMSALLFIVSTLTEHHKVTQLAKLLRNLSVGSLGLFFTVFLSVMSVQGAATAVTDGITIKTAKFLAGNFIPVVGRMVTDATDTVMSASMLLKNTVGMVGVIVLLFICIFPAVKVLVLGLIYNIAAALLQPLGGGPIIDCLEIIGKSVMYIFAALAAVSIMFFLAITILVAAGNITLMVR